MPRARTGGSADPTAKRLVDFVEGLRLNDVPGPIVEKAKLHILDGLGAALGCSQLDTSKRISRALRKQGGRGESTVWAYGFKSSVSAATMINGMLVEALDYSDIHVGAGLHPTSVILPALLTLGETTSASGRDLLEAYIAGCEAMIRLGEAAPGEFHQRGFQPTSAIGVLASALAVGKMIRLSRAQLTEALSLASILAFGSSLSVRVGSYFGGIDTGRASESGMLAALQASEGVRGIASDPIEGRFGFLETHAGKGNYSLLRLTSGLGERWDFGKTFLKRYPTSYVHTYCLDAALRLRMEHRFDPSEIRGVRFGEKMQNITLFAEPQRIKRVPKTIYDAKTSNYFLIAAALLDGGISISTLTEKKIRERAILALAGRVSYVRDEGECWVEVTLKDGTKLKTAQNDLVPSSREAVLGKFLSNVGVVLRPDRGRALMASILSLESAKNLHGIVENLVA